MSGLPLLDVVTRHLVSPRRAALLEQQRASLAFPSADWVQTLLVDPHGRGVGASHVRLRTYEPYGRCVWVLDDDDLCLEPALLELLDESADMQIFKMHYGARQKVIPDAITWERGAAAAPRPTHAARRRFPSHISAQCVVFSRDYWLVCRHLWTDAYDGDRQFLGAAYDHASRVIWTDRIIAALTHHNRGTP
jgi:hypothetical protein